ncbi:hypothetical protein B0H13DRAFT_2312612 [Mycena leptocephala]|nr:hypothetical protein B0H13DRAFT_2312612 [Mycena leptocephala]
MAIPTLPTDLERLIFELAAFIDPKSMPSFILVAKRGKIWIEPLLYHVLSLHMAFQEPHMLRYPLHHLFRADISRLGVLRKHVRHICMEGKLATQGLTMLLKVCDATVDLALFPGTATQELLPILGTLRLQRLSVDLRSMFWRTGTDFTHITHLDILDMPKPGWDEELSGLKHIPGLTHLSFYHYGAPISGCRSALEHCKMLQVLAIVCESQFELNRHAPRCAELAFDRRFVMLVVGDRLEDWESGARGEDYWIRTEELVRKRRSGEMKSR